MFDELLEKTAVEVRAHLVELQNEKAIARSSGVGNLDTYMADLDEEIEATRQLYVASAVTEIASLRAEISGRDLG